MVLVILFPVCLYTVFGAKKGFIQPSDVQNMQQKEQGNFFGETKDCNDLPWWRRWWCKHKDDNVDKPPVPPVVSTSTPGAARITVRGSELFDPEGKEISLRGFNWANYRNGGLLTTQQNVKDIKAMGATTVRIPLRWYWGSGDTQEESGQESRMTDAPGHINPVYLAMLDKYIQWAVDEKLWVILFIGSDPQYDNQARLQEFTETWAFLAERYKNTPYIGAYELLSEPHPKAPYTNQVVKDLDLQIIAAIRKVDTRTPIIVGPAKAEGCIDGPYDIRCLEQIYLENTPNIIYTFNFYEPPEYVKINKIEGGDPYPGWTTDRKSKTGEKFYLDKVWLATLIQKGIDFQKSHNVPLFVNQIGVPSLTTGSKEYTQDVLDIFTKNDIGFTWWLYAEVSDKHSKYEGGRGVVWEDAKIAGLFHRKEDWIALFTDYFKK